MSGPPILEIHKLQFGWTTEDMVLDIDQLEIEKGGKIFIQGPSGCGKSTLLSLLGGVLQPTKGSIRILGQDLTALSRASCDRFRADHIGFIFQQFNLIPYLGIVENLLLPPRFSKLRRERVNALTTSMEKEAIRLLEALGLKEEGLTDRPVTQLSVGQQQRVAAARSLLGEPEIIIADEPTSSLDQFHRASFLELLQEECTRAGATLVFVSHDTTLEQFFDRKINLPEINRAQMPGATLP